MSEIQPPKKKRGRGRPKSAEVARDKVNNWFRSTPTQSQRWKRAAKKAGIPFRTWIKIILDRAVGVDLAPDALEEVAS